MEIIYEGVTCTIGDKTKVSTSLILLVTCERYETVIIHMGTLYRENSNIHMLQDNCG